MNLYQKFRSQEILTQIPPGRIIAAVSGGADSVCLLHMLKRVSREKHWRPVAVHIQHHLRGKDSLKDQAFVEALAGKWGIDFEAREIHPPKEKKTEEKSRIFRYAQLGSAALQWKAGAVLVAHNANDQAETFLLHLLRGSGPDGLAGMPAVRSLREVTGEPAHTKIRLVRPLLAFSRKDILQYLISQGQAYRTDHSNQDLHYRRNWIRHKLIPLLEEAQPRIVERVTNLSRLLTEQKHFMDLQLETMEKSLVRWGGNPPGRELDLTRLFQYNNHLRQYFLHRLRPQDSFQEISELQSFLKKRQKVPLKL